MAADYAPCADISAPYSAKFDLALPALPATLAAEAPLLGAARARVPKGPVAEGLEPPSATVGSAEDALFRSPDPFVEGLGDGSPGRLEVALSAAGHVARFVGKSLTLILDDAARAAQFSAPPAGPAAGTGRLLPILMIALLGGLIRNVMPCLVPVVSLKLISTPGQAGVDRRRARVGLVTTAR
jgi:suppressor for copper-sensitivity B